MLEQDFQFRDNVTLIGGGECRRETLEEALRIAPRLVAADGGATRALAWGRAPELVIGDIDSLDCSVRASFSPDQICQIDEQDSTDFAKVLRVVTAPLILGVGFLGGRLDHTLASLNVLANDLRAIVLLGEHDLCLHVPERIAVDLPPGMRVSLFPLAKISVRGSGLVWPLDDLRMAPDGQIGTSNQVGATGKVVLEFDRPGMLLMLAPSALNAVLAAIRPQTPKIG